MPKGLWGTKKKLVGCAPNGLRRNGIEYAAAFDYIQTIKSDVTKGLIQDGSSAERGPLAPVGVPLANIQKRTWEMMVNRMWIAILKPQITGKYSEKRKTTTYWKPKKQ